ncbi:hypothetical protein BDV95DRAFT_490358 [Massariosphaeria phaeospora]|uniref:DUF1690-domain-containing protein n=1 Tax=Massariosphaeria phaeospora TaxID=100035 RepID=A0A7C8MGS3_9PLEO|nr:hypothetical protein BDV95DRAFT_490358 [Massariosphaeria phaeospora]
MGAENSKPAGEVAQHVFSADAPVRFSNQLVDSLQKNTHTDSARQKQHELEYQQRLTAELEKLRDQESQHLTELSDALSTESHEPVEPTLTDKLSDVAFSSDRVGEKKRQNEMSRSSVTKEIEALKKKLEDRKKIDQVSPQVGKAKDDVVACLRMHDRRPLDCWKEVETFKKEVGRLEKDFVEKTIR